MTGATTMQRSGSGWRHLPFDEAFIDATGGQPKLQRKDYQLVGRYAVIDQGATLIGGYTDDERLVARVRIPAILFGDHTKLFKWVDEPFVLGADGVKIIEPIPSIEPKYAYYYLRSLRLPDDAGYSRHFKFLKRTTLPIPPTKHEQRRIATILDKADAIRRKRRQALAETDTLLRAAYLELVGFRNASHGCWPLVRIEDLAAPHRNAMRTGPFGSDLLHSEFVDKGIAVLGIDNAVQNRFAWGERRFITAEKYVKLQRYRVFPRDVIVTIMGTTGRSAVVPDDIPEAITTKHLATITPDQDRVHPIFLSFAIHSDPLVTKQIMKANKGAIMAGLNLGIIKNIEVRLPPLRNQECFADVANKIYRQQSRLVDPAVNGHHLFQSLSQRAFRGEL